VSYPIDVTGSGAVSLGADVVCDGFLKDAKARVQTHVHTDHLCEFETSKGLQTIILSEPTRQLLCHLFNADLPYRSNIKSLDYDKSFTLNETNVTLISNAHMLGSVQVAVERQDGMRLGYSGDFAWPLDKVIEVDALVLDSTYGSPSNIRQYDQDQCEESFLSLVHTHIGQGPMHIHAHRGTLQRALQILNGETECSLLGSEKLCREVEIYSEFGYAIAPLTNADTVEGKEAISSGRFIRFYGTGDRKPTDVGNALTIKLSAYFAKPDNPVNEYSDRSFCVAISNHADFNGTLDYARESGAKYIVTDNSRGGKGYDLAVELRTRLGIEAKPSSNRVSYSWGE
jgi:putative mRNA 3-end processing factor